MTLTHTAVVALLISVFAASGFSADNRPHYEMFGVTTDIWARDADYNFSPPIVLHRKKNTYDMHRIEFEAMRYSQECTYWEQVCVAYNPQGQCTRWENRCARYELRGYPITKQIELSFHEMPDLVDGQDETYELTITRRMPNGPGEDWITTWMKPESTTVPAIVQRMGDFNYRVKPKP